MKYYAVIICQVHHTGIYFVRVYIWASQKADKEAHQPLQISKVTFCRVGGFRVRVWECCRTHTNSGYSGTGVQKTHRSSGQVQKMLYPYPGYCGTGPTELTEVPGTGMNVIQNSQKFRVQVWKSYRTHRSSRYCGTGVQNSQKYRAGTKCSTRTPGIVATGVQN